MKFITTIATTLVLSTAQLLALEYSSFKEMSENAQRVYLAGLVEGLILTHGSNELLGYPQLICFPSDVVLDSDKASEALAKTSNVKHVGTSVMLGFRKMYPCN